MLDFDSRTCTPIPHLPSMQTYTSFMEEAPPPIRQATAPFSRRRSLQQTTYSKHRRCEPNLFQVDIFHTFNALIAKRAAVSPPRL